MASTKKSRNWLLQGKTVRKGAGNAGSGSGGGSTRSSTPQVQSTSSTVFGGGIKDPSGRTTEYFSMEDACPVCKSDRYLNPKLRLLVSSSCYHKMCESCIDRLFTLGPAPCPAPEGCNKVLRKLAFAPQTFEDLGVEKEVAIRRRLAKDFNKTREDFDDLRTYNDYLQEVEDIAFNLINNIDVPQMEARIAEYRAANAAVIALNIQREEAYAAALKEHEDLERKEREARAAELQREEDEEREERERGKREIIDKLETSQKDAHKVVAKSRANALKRSNAKATATASASMAFNYAKLLKARNSKAAIPDEPHVPLQDDYYAYEDMYVLQPDGYEDPFSEAVRKDHEGIMRGGGYMVEEAWVRALRSAVAGLNLAPLIGLPPASSGGSTMDTDTSQPILTGLDGGGDVMMGTA